MKNLIFPLVFTIALASCSDQSDLPDNVCNQSAQFSKYRSIDEAIQIADKVLAAESVGARSGAKLKSAETAHIIMGSRSRSGEADTLLYALDLEDDGGFVLVAAPKSVEPIMAIIDSGSYTDPENQENIAYQQTLDVIKNYVSVQFIGGGGVIPDPILPPIFQLAEYYDTIKINRLHEPVVETAWSQKWPANLYALNGLAGCVPVAIGQILATMEKPDKITYTFPDSDVKEETFDWKEIKKHKRVSDGYWCFDCPPSSTNHKTIGRFVREIGYLANADYKEKELITLVKTNLYAENLIYKFAGKRPDSKGSTLTSLYSDIDYNGGLALVSCKILNDTITHVFIADATRNIQYSIIRHYLEDPTSKDYITEYVKHEKINLIHYNWGNGGSCNGWFNIDAVNPNTASEYDYPNDLNYDRTKYDKNVMSYWYYKL